MENPIPKFSMSRLKFIKQGSNLSDGNERWPNFLESQDNANECFGVVGCIQGCKTGVEAFL